MRDSDLTKLRRARSRCHVALKQAEALVTGYQAKLTDLEARIHAIAPELALPAQHRTYRPNPHFARGELPKVALAVMREAGEPLAVRAIAARALARKGCRTPDRHVYKMTRVRLQQLFARLDRKGVTQKIGRGRDTRRGLAR